MSHFCTQNTALLFRLPLLASVSFAAVLRFLLLIFRKKPYLALIFVWKGVRLWLKADTDFLQNSIAECKNTMCGMKMDKVFLSGSEE